MQKPPHSSAFAAQAVLSDDGVIIPGTSITAIESTTQTNQSSEEDVHITFGIQDSIERVWHAALEKVGSLSLAWQSEAAHARVTVAADVDPELVFDNVNKSAKSADNMIDTSQRCQAPAGTAADTILDTKHQPRFRLHRPPRRSRAVVRPRSITQLSNGSSRHTVHSDEHDGVHSLQLAGLREKILRDLAQDGGFSDHAAETHRIKSRRFARGQRKTGSGRVMRLNKLAAPKAQSISKGAVSTALSPISVPVPLSSARSQRAKRRNRASIRLERLLPPRTSALPQTPVYTGKPRSVSLPAGFTADSNQALSLPQISVVNHSHAISASNCKYDVPKEAETAINPMLTRRRANSLPAAVDRFTDLSKQNGSLEEEVIAASLGWSQSDICISSLEEKVSGMFTELGHKSPYLDTAHIDSGRTRRQRMRVRGKSADFGKRSSRESSVHRKQRTVDTIPWFYQKQYIAAGIQHGSTERNVLLVDDDSSCADFAADADCHCCSHVCTKSSLANCAYKRSRFPHRRLTGASGLSAADGSNASTAFDYSQQRLLFSPRSQGYCRLNTPNITVYSQGSRPNTQCKKSSGSSFSASPLIFTGECRSCCDQKKPCSQMHNILARIEQADHYIYSVSQNASAIDSLLADLRAQSRSLTETLSISQTRASALGHTVTQAIHKDARSTICSYEEADSVSSVRGGSVRSEKSIRLKDYLIFSKKAHELKKRASSLGVHQSGASTAEVEARHIASASESDNERQTLPRRDPLYGPAKGPSKCPRRVCAANLTAREKNSSKQRFRRPEQPILVRVQRINNQWTELQSAIKKLGLDNVNPAAEGSADQRLGGNAEMSAIAADGLKLIQRVLKTTLESLSSANQQHVAIEN